MIYQYDIQNLIIIDKYSTLLNKMFYNKYLLSETKFFETVCVETITETVQIKNVQHRAVTYTKF